MHVMTYSHVIDIVLRAVMHINITRSDFLSILNVSYQFHAVFDAVIASVVDVIKLLCSRCNHVNTTQLKRSNYSYFKYRLSFDYSFKRKS